MIQRKWSGLQWWPKLAIAVVLLSFVGAIAGWVPRPQLSVRVELEDEEGYQPDYQVNAGRELAMIYIGSSTCEPSNRDWLPGAVDSLKVVLRETARAQGRGFSTIGIARDWVVADGLEYLRKFGRFDEVMAGRNWLGTGVLRYVWDAVPGPASTPQILVVDRLVSSTRDPARPVRAERLVLRKVGTEEIRAWFERGGRLPELRRIEKEQVEQ